jgi:hypothetical protein
VVALPGAGSVHRTDGWTGPSAHTAECGTTTSVPS